MRQFAPSKLQQRPVQTQPGILVYYFGGHAAVPGTRARRMDARIPPPILLSWCSRQRARSHMRAGHLGPGGWTPAFDTCTCPVLQQT